MDNYSVFAVDAYRMSDVEAAELSTWAAGSADLSDWRRYICRPNFIN